jgi:hypothetical protein
MEKAENAIKKNRKWNEENEGIGEESRPPLWSSGQSSWLHNGDVLCLL